MTLDQVRLEDAMVTDKRRYLEPINFATNFAFFRDDEGHHTRVVSANYWAGYGAKECLDVVLPVRRRRAGVGRMARGPAEPVSAPSLSTVREVRERFGLGAFTGQLFLHAINASGHDVVKYALDTYGDAPEVLSCTHDANAWPSDLYAGLPAPADGERVTLWVQNSHPCAIPAGTIGLNRMGDDAIVRLDRGASGLRVLCLGCRGIAARPRLAGADRDPGGQAFRPPAL